MHIAVVQILKIVVGNHIYFTLSAQGPSSDSDVYRLSLHWKNYIYIIAVVP